MLLAVTPTSVALPAAPHADAPAAEAGPPVDAALPWLADDEPADAPPVAPLAPPAPSAAASWSPPWTSDAAPADTPLVPLPLACASSLSLRRAPHALATSIMARATKARRVDRRIRTRDPGWQSPGLSAPR